MAKKRLPVVSKTTLARERARARVGPVPPGCVVPDKRRREKHRPDWRADTASE